MATRSNRMWRWVCSCGTMGRANFNRTRARNGKNQHMHDFHKSDPKFKADVEEAFGPWKILAERVMVERGVWS